MIQRHTFAIGLSIVLFIGHPAAGQSPTPGARYNRAVRHYNDGEYRQPADILADLEEHHPDYYATYSRFWDTLGRIDGEKAVQAAVRRAAARFKEAPVGDRTEDFNGAYLKADDDPREVGRANKLLLEVSRMYSELPALTDEMTTVFSMTGRPEQKSRIQVRLSKNAVEATGIVPPRTLDVYAVDGYLYLQLKGAEGAVKAEVGDDPLACAKKVMGIAYPYLPPQIILRWTKGIDCAGEWFTLGMLEKAVVAGYAIVDVEGGAKRHEVLFEGTTPLLDWRPGTCRVQIDPKTKLVTDIVIEGGTDGADKTFRMTAQFKPKTPARLERPIVFDLGKNIEQYVDFGAMLSVSLGGVDPTIEAGTAAPMFELVDQNGKKHVSSAYRGKIMVLDWWGLWCLACKQDLPKVQVLHEKYADNPDVVILAMNVGDDNEKVARYWAEKKYTFPTLNDADELAHQYGIKAYPSVILIGPDGLIIHAESGSQRNLEEELKKALETIK